MSIAMATSVGSIDWEMCGLFALWLLLGFSFCCFSASLLCLCWQQQCWSLMFDMIGCYCYYCLYSMIASTSGLIHGSTA